MTFQHGNAKALIDGGGADNLAQLDQWKNWQSLMETVPVCVIARPGFEKAVLGARAAQVYGPARIDASDAGALLSFKAPVWTLLQEQLSSLSSTAIRASKD